MRRAARAAIGACLVACASTKAPIATPSRAPVVTHASFLDYDYVHDVYGIDALTDTQAKGRWHWELEATDGIVTSAREVSPTGVAESSRIFARTADGTFVVTYVDPYGDRADVATVDKNGLERHTQQSGFVGIDGCHQRRVIADARGRRVETVCLDPRGAVTTDADGCERSRMKLDDRGNTVSVLCLHDDGSAMLRPAAPYEWRVTVDELGYVKSVDALDVDGSAKTFGCARATLTYDPVGKPATRWCTTASGSFEGAERTRYDEHGCAMSQAAIGVDGMPIERDGLAVTAWRRDAHCGVLEERTLDKAGHLTANTVVHRYELDRHGNPVVERCFNDARTPAPCRAFAAYSEAATVLRREYDERGRTTAVVCQDADARPAPCDHGYPSREEHEYGADGLDYVVRFVDAARRPALGHGVSWERLEHDFAGRTSSRRSFGMHDEAVVSELGCHEIRWDRDDRHRLAQVACFGVNGEPRATRMCLEDVCWPEGSTRVVVVRTGDWSAENVFFDGKGHEIQRVGCDRARCYW
jgi:hypothetical protein